jgi:Major Facilitator Superfamily
MPCRLAAKVSGATPVKVMSRPSAELSAAAICAWVMAAGPLRSASVRTMAGTGAPSRIKASRTARPVLPVAPASRDELLTELVIDAYHDLAGALADAVGQVPSSQAPAQLEALARSYRAWALAQPHRYRLLPGRSDGAERPGSGVLAGLRNHRLLRPAGVFFASTMATGVLVTFLPLSVTAATATLALFAQPAATTAARWAAGRIGDRRGHARLLCPGVVLCAVGIACLAATHTPALVAAGAACFGTGFGILQNATLVMMYACGATTGYSAVSAIWNAAYDAGMSAGALGIGLFAGHTGYPAAFLVTAGLIVPALIPARREQRSGPRAKISPPQSAA